MKPIDLVQEETGLALPQRQEMPILRKARSRLDPMSIRRIILPALSALLGLIAGIALTFYFLRPYELERRQAVDIQMAASRLCDGLFVDAVASGEIVFRRLGREDALARASVRCLKISETVMGMVYDMKVAKRQAPNDPIRSGQGSLPAPRQGRPR